MALARVPGWTASTCAACSPTTSRISASTGSASTCTAPDPAWCPLRAAFEELLRSAIADREPGHLLLGHKHDRRNTAARATERAALHNVPHIEPARLRATWLADLMTDAIPLAVILQAAGLKSARTLSELQPHLGPWLALKGLVTDEAAVMRGESR